MFLKSLEPKFAGTIFAYSDEGSLFFRFLARCSGTEILGPFADLNWYLTKLPLLYLI